MIHSYTKLLALIYFKNQADKYDLTELCSILGLTHSQLDNLLRILFEENLLKYNRFDEMCISKKGLDYLERNHATNNEYKSSNMSLSIINEEKAKPIDYIYIPKDFNKKT